MGAVSGMGSGLGGAYAFLINLSQMAIFMRHGFVAMYSFRLFYYTVWHVAWGYVRLKILFYTTCIGEMGWESCESRKSI